MKKSSPAFAQVERPVIDILLDSAILLARQEAAAEFPCIVPLGHRPADSPQHLATPGIIDRPAVVGVHQAEVPQLGPLVGVRHARARRA